MRLYSQRDKGIPELPQSVEVGRAKPPFGLVPERVNPDYPQQVRSLRAGCYLVRYTPTERTGLETLHYDGTLRVERDGFNTIASGDLYAHQPFRLPFFPQVRALQEPALGDWSQQKASNDIQALLRSREPNPSRGIPIFSRDRYRYYLRVTSVLERLRFPNRFSLGFELHRYDSATNSFSLVDEVTAEMVWKPAPSSYPSSSDYLEGEVRDSHAQVLAHLTMGWVSPFLRKATIELDRVTASEPLLNNGEGLDWRAVFNPVGWDVDVIESDDDVAEPSGEFWSDAECHAKMLQRRDSQGLDHQWRYHLLSVRRLDSTARGLMYDAYATDSNNIPHEGAVIASHWTIPQRSMWGPVAGKRLGQASAAYFRTAVHELGHAQGLRHDTSNNGFMNTTETIAASPGTFPTNIDWAHSPIDQKRLKHLPDIWVRPGGVPFGSFYNSAPISPDDDEVQRLPGLTLKVSPLLDVVPLGAPIRINIELVNECELPMPVPPSLRMRAGHVRGTVANPSGARRDFRPLLHHVDQAARVRFLNPGESIQHSVTLLRGKQGALFPTPGLHSVEVQVVWELDGTRVFSSGKSDVLVSGVQNEAHAHAAKIMLSTPDALLTMVLGGDHLTDGQAALDAAFQNPVLRPHVAFIHAKRLGQKFGTRPADRETAMKIIAGDCVLSGAEMSRAAHLVLESDHPKLKKEATQRLRSLVNVVPIGDGTRALMNELWLHEIP